MIYQKTFRRDYRLRPKNSGAPEALKGETLVTELGVEDLHRVSPGEVAKYASPANRKWAGRLISGNAGYWGTATSNKHLDTLLRDGWPEGTALIADLTAEIQELIPHPIGPRRKLRWQDQGDEIDMGKVYGGQLDRAWRAAPRQRSQATRVISIDADVGQNCHISADSLLWSGVAAVALTNALEQAGYRVELFSSSAMRSNVKGNGASLTRMIAKRSTEPLNIGLAAALVALPATFRWCHVMSWLAHPADVGRGYGQSAHLTEVLDAAAMEGLIAGSEVQLTGALSREQAVKQVTDTIDRLKVGEQSAFGNIV